MGESHYDFSAPIEVPLESVSVTDVLVAYTESDPDRLVHDITIITPQREKRIFRVALSDDMVQYRDLTSDGIIQVGITHTLQKMDSRRSPILANELPDGLFEQIQTWGSITGFCKTKEDKRFITPMKAQPLYMSAIEYLQSRRWYPYPAIADQWDRDPSRKLDDVIGQFDAISALLKREPGTKTQTQIEEEAAFTTWTGLRANDLGFKKAKVFNDTPGVSVIFYR